MPSLEARQMPEPEAIRLLAAHGLAYPAHGMARTEQEAVGIAESLGYPVVLKVVSSEVVHKSDAGGVIAGVSGPTQVTAAFAKILGSVAGRHPGAGISGILVCRQAEPSLELVVGGMRDEIFGPVVMFGIGGIYIEVYRDVSFRVCPLSNRDAFDMIREIRGYGIVKGMRGQGSRNIDALADAILRISRMMEMDAIREIDLNPIRVYDDGILVLDARILTEVPQDCTARGAL